MTKSAKKPLIRISIPLVVTGISAAVAFIGFTLVDSGSEAELEVPAPETPTEAPIRFGAPNRDRLAICVEGVNAAPSVQSDAASATRNALDTLANEPAWIRLNWSNPAPAVEEDCPSGPALHEPSGGPDTGDSLFFVAGRVVEQASYFKLHVYIVTAEEIARLGNPVWRWPSQERICGHGCVQVTTALYLTAEEMNDQSFFLDSLAKALGLRSSF